jgi:hypothetical protein
MLATEGHREAEPRLPSKWLLYGFVAFLAIGAGFVVANPNGTEPPANCQRSSLNVLPSTLSTGYPLSWFTTGPKGSYVITVGVSKLNVGRAGNPAVAVADKGNERDATIEGKAFTMGDCKGSGMFKLRQGRGGQTVRVYRLDGGAPRVVATAEITSRGPVDGGP